MVSRIRIRLLTNPAGWGYPGALWTGSKSPLQRGGNALFDNRWSSRGADGERSSAPTLYRGGHAPGPRRSGPVCAAAPRAGLISRLLFDPRGHRHLQQLPVRPSRLALAVGTLLSRPSPEGEPPGREAQAVGGVEPRVGEFEPVLVLDRGEQEDPATLAELRRHQVALQPRQLGSAPPPKPGEERLGPLGLERVRRPAVDPPELGDEVVDEQVAAVEPVVARELEVEDLVLDSEYGRAWGREGEHHLAA